MRRQEGDDVTQMLETRPEAAALLGTDGVVRGQLVSVEPRPDGAALVTVLVPGGADLAAPPGQDSGEPMPAGPAMICEPVGLAHDAGERSVFVGEVLIRLSVRQYAVFALLVGHSGQVLMPDQLLQHAWKDALESDVGALRSLIYRLRARLGVAGVTIEEKHGGYRFNPRPKPSRRASSNQRHRSVTGASSARHRRVIGAG